MNRPFSYAFLLLVLVFGPSSASAETGSLYDVYSRRAVVKISVSAPTDISDRKALDPASLKQALEKALQERKSIHFQPVSSESDAELVLDSEVQGFVFSETDPVDMLIGAGAVAMDAAIQDHFASTEVLFTVRDAKTGKILWKDKVKASVTDHTMSESQSKDKVAEKLADMLMRHAFGKRKK